MYTYWSNKTGWHCKLLLIVFADSLSEADKLFEYYVGLDPKTNNWISVQHAKAANQDQQQSKTCKV